MPSPFPGMDPFLESQDWDDFHVDWMTELRRAIVRQVRPRYAVKVERRVYVTRVDEKKAEFIVPDTSIVRGEVDAPMSGGGTATVTALEPVLLRLPRREERRQTFLTIRKPETKEIVTVIETLSPDNKRKGKGRRKYLRKRRAVLSSSTHLVELDLLRGGLRLPMDDPLPAADYFAFVSRAEEPQAEVYAWKLPRRLPEIPIPLADEDPDVRIDLQAVFDTVYDRAGYDYTLDYQAPLQPPLSEDEQRWVAQVLTDRTPGQSLPG